MLKFLLLFLLSTESFARDLQTIARMEPNWSNGTLYMADNLTQPIADGFLTDQGDFRVAAISPEISISVGIESDWIKQMGVNSFIRDCDQNAAGLDEAEHNLVDQKFSLILKVPFFENQKSLVFYNEGYSSTTIRSLMKIMSAKVSLRFFPDAKSHVHQPVVLERLRLMIGADIDRNLSKLQNDGELRVPLSSFTSIACDVLQNKMEISLKAVWYHQDALLSRKPIISDNELRKVYTKSRVDLSNLKSATDKLLVSSAAVALGMKDATQKNLEKFGEQNYISLFNSLFDISNYRWQVIGSRNFETVARSLDELRVTTSETPTVIKMRFNGEVL